MIELKNIKKGYWLGKSYIEILHDINLDINKGDFIAIMGPSGCGKSTLLNLLGCMDRFEKGFYYYEDKNVGNMKSKELAKLRNEKIGFIFQAFNLIEDLNALENIQVPMGYRGTNSKTRKLIAEHLLEQVGLKEKYRNRPSELSGGQQQRIAIARALSNKPEILLADEPTGNLDSKSGIEIMEFIKKLHKEGMTVVMVTHDSQIASYASKVIHVIDGKIV